MGLPAGQQQALDGIEGTLRSRDPRLASMFSIFTRLADQDPMPRLEDLVPKRLEELMPRGRAMVARVGRGLGRACTPRYRLRAVMILPVLLLVIGCVAVLGPLTRGPGCGIAPQGRTSAALTERWIAVCDAHQAAPLPR